MKRNNEEQLIAQALETVFTEEQKQYEQGEVPPLSPGFKARMMALRSNSWTDFSSKSTLGGQRIVMQSSVVRTMNLESLPDSMCRRKQGASMRNFKSSAWGATFCQLVNKRGRNSSIVAKTFAVWQ